MQVIRRDNVGSPWVNLKIKYLKPIKLMINNWESRVKIKGAISGALGTQNITNKTKIIK